MKQNDKKSINQLFISLLLIGLWLFSIIQLIPVGIDQYSYFWPLQAVLHNICFERRIFEHAQHAFYCCQTDTSQYDSLFPY